MARVADSGEPWMAGLSPDASPAAIALAKWLWQNGARPNQEGTWQGAPNQPGAVHVPALDPAQTPGYQPPVYTPPVVAPQVQNDPSYIDALGDLTRQRHDTIVNYGDASGTGADAATAGEAANNPYSIVNQLRKLTSTNTSNLNDQANAHGVLFSGANNQVQQNEYAAGAQRGYDARKSLLDALNGLTSQQHAAYWNAYNRLNGTTA